MTALTPEVLQKCAERLGASHIYHVDHRKEYSLWDLRFPNRVCTQFSDGDLLLAILNKAAERGYKRCTLREAAGILVQFHRLPDWLGVWHGKADNELEAAMLAFAQLPLEGGNG